MPGLKRVSEPSLLEAVVRSWGHVQNEGGIVCGAAEAPR